jgi:hypothetical protein
MLPLLFCRKTKRSTGAEERSSEDAERKTAQGFNWWRLEESAYFLKKSIILDLSRWALFRPEVSLFCFQKANKRYYRVSCN